MELVRSRGLKHVKVGVFDVDGVLRGKHMAVGKFESAVEHGFGFCDVVFGWDSYDQLYDNVKFTGWHTGYPDAQVRIVPSTCRELPLEGNGLLFLGEFTGAAETLCPRSLLRRVIKKANQMGFIPAASFEYEFFVFNESRESIREKRYRNLTPMAPGYFGYSMLRNCVDAEYYNALLDLCETMDFGLEGLHEETGPGVLEAAITVDTGLSAADKAALFKTFVKVASQKLGTVATFMAKWSPDWPGQSGHLHLSLKRESGGSAFHDPAEPNQMSDVMKHFVAGQQVLLPKLLCMVAPTVNSFTRMIPGFWAPTHSTWGIENRTCALRVIPGSEKSQRCEYRIAAADGNPYLVLAAALASGLWGIENKTELPPPVKGNAYAQTFPDNSSLPRTLWDAAQRFKNSSMAKEWFGEAFVEHYAATREWEEREFRRSITDWELERYFEII